MGFMTTIKSHGASGNKAIKAKYNRTVNAYSEDLEKVIEVKLTLNTVVLDTSSDGLLSECDQGGSVKAGEHGTVTYKSEASERLTEAVASVLDADIANAEASEAPKAKKPRKRGTQADTLETSQNGDGATA
jgi:hypothetical protein